MTMCHVLLGRCDGVMVGNGGPSTAYCIIPNGLFSIVKGSGR